MCATSSTFIFRDLAIKAFCSLLQSEHHAEHHPLECSDPRKELPNVQRTCAELVQRAIQDECNRDARFLHINHLIALARDANMSAVKSIEVKDNLNYTWIRY